MTEEDTELPEETSDSESETTNADITPVVKKPGKTFWIISVLLIVIIGLSVYCSRLPEPTKKLPPPSPALRPTPSTIPTPIHRSGQPTPTPNTSLKLNSLNLDLQSFPALDGATATQPLRSLIACKALSLTCDWEEETSREMFVYPRYTESFGNPDWQILMDKLINSKTHDAYVNLINGEVDLIINATLPSADEQLLASEKGVILDPTPIGLDGFIFMVNKKNPVKNLSTEDIVKIYTNKITNWKEVGGLNMAIGPFVRQKNSGSQELMEKLIMRGTPMGEFPEEQRIEAMMTLIEGVDQKENSIGYSLYYYKKTMVDQNKDNPAVRVIAVDQVDPTPQTIAAKIYPHVFYIYAVTRDNLSPDSTAYKIKQWLRSSEGQALVSEAGYSVLK